MSESPLCPSDISPKYDDSAVGFGGEHDKQSFYENKNFHFKSNRPLPKFEPPLFAGRIWGGLGRGQMPRPPRSNPKTRTRAIELRKELTPAERKLWAYLRGDKLGVNFRRQHAIGNFIPDLCVSRKNSSSNWMEVSTWSKRNTMKKEQSILNRLATK